MPIIMFNKRPHTILFCWACVWASARARMIQSILVRACFSLVAAAQSQFQWILFGFSRGVWRVSFVLIIIILYIAFLVIYSRTAISYIVQFYWWTFNAQPPPCSLSLQHSFAIRLCSLIFRSLPFVWFYLSLLVRFADDVVVVAAGFSFVLFSSHHSFFASF